MFCFKRKKNRVKFSITNEEAAHVNKEKFMENSDPKCCEYHLFISKYMLKIRGLITFFLYL